MLLICWWAIYIIGAVILQRFIPGVDALLPGLLVSLHDRKPAQTFWLFIIFVLIQEGCGSLMFGSAILWYGGVIVLFRMLQGLVMPESIVFILVLSAVAGGFHGALTLLMCSVQNIMPHHSMVLRESIVQALLIPPMWGLVQIFRPRFAAFGGRP